MSRLRVGCLTALALIVSSCGADVVGPGVPECGSTASDGLATATIIQLQAVRNADWGPCIDDLEVGWDYVAQIAESGRSVFWLNSDRVGSRFLEVELTSSCDIGGAEAQPGPGSGIDRFVRVDEEPRDVVIAVIPVAERHIGDARALVVGMIGTVMEGRKLAPYVDESAGSAPVRIEAALRTVGIALVLDDTQITTDTLELRRKGHDPRVGISRQKALDDIEADLGPPAYRAEWFHTFTGGCIVYRFDARGSGAEAIAREVRDALGFYPLVELRESARASGLDI